MAHLACIEHSKRVLVTRKDVLHRSDGAKCTSPSVRIGKRFYSRWEIALLIPHVTLKTGALKESVYLPQKSVY